MPARSSRVVLASLSLVSAEPRGEPRLHPSRCRAHLSQRRVNGAHGSGDLHLPPGPGTASARGRLPKADSVGRGMR